MQRRARPQTYQLCLVVQLLPQCGACSTGVLHPLHMDKAECNL